MRKVTQEIKDAFEAGKSRKLGNTRTDGTTVWLHGNEIIKKEGKDVKFTLAGWPTPTTRERVKGITGADVYQKKGEQMLGDEIISSREWYDSPDGRQFAPDTSEARYAADALDAPIVSRKAEQLRQTVLIAEAGDELQRVKKQESKGESKKDFKLLSSFFPKTPSSPSTDYGSSKKRVSAKTPISAGSPAHADYVDKQMNLRDSFSESEVGAMFTELTTLHIGGYNELLRMDIIEEYAGDKHGHLTPGSVKLAKEQLAQTMETFVSPNPLTSASAESIKKSSSKKTKNWKTSKRGKKYYVTAKGNKVYKKN